ncbi:uncharacterized protein PFB0765w-like isoform X2 [Myzus persicae]|uniref:uncharacterized protein PFB0765w-like isoform X2 n=1 Tax=Myzus persicae TaxID=13164 RepID=UPI000B937890|nr:uncharacterized protein PFB0765w-like isoform X2 [Myzus persicae]
MEKNVHNKRRFRFRTKIMLHEVQKCKKEKEKKNAITSSSIISNDSKNDGVNTIILKRKRRRGKKKKQKNGNSKSDKPKFNSQKHRNIQTNEKNSFGLNKQLVDTSTNIIISLANDKLNSSILRPQVKIIKKKMDKKPKSHNTNILENNNVVCTDKCQIKECLEFLLNCHDHQKKTYKDKKSKQKKKNKRNSKMVVQEKTEVSNEVIRHKYSKINEYLEKNAFESHSKEIYYDDHYSNCGMQTPRGNEKNPLLLKKLFKNKKKKKKKVFKDVTQKEIIPPKKDTIERQQSITTSEKKFPDNDITTDCKNYDRYIFKKYFEFLSAHTVNDKDATMITPYSSSKTLIASDDDPFLSNKSLKKKEKRKASKVMTSEIMIPKKSKKSKRQATLVNEYSGKDAPLIASMDKKTYNSDGYVYEGSGKNYKFFCAQGDNMARADINIDPGGDQRRNRATEE